MTQMFKVSDPGETRGNSVTAREILDKASKDVDSGLANDPQLQAQMLNTMGTVYENMMLAATQAGIAFSNSSVALVHGMSRPIGAHFHVPHGMSNAMLLPAITTFSVPGNVGRYADCARVMGIAKSEANDESAAAALVEGLRQLNSRLEVPTLPGAFSGTRAGVCLQPAPRVPHGKSHVRAGRGMGIWLRSGA